MKIIIDSTIPFIQGILEPIAQVKYLDSKDLTSDAIRDADALMVRSIDKCTASLLNGSKVKLITTATIGFDHIDTAYCEANHIHWQNAPGCNARSVAQYLLCVLLDVALKEKLTLKGKTLGIIGVGHVGKQVENICKAYGMHILRYDPPRVEQEGADGFVSLEKLTSESDIITFHTPLTHDGNYPTYHFASSTFFKQLKRKPWIINTCRGGVIDTPALLSALQKQQVSKVFVDCWENEPHPSEKLLQQVAFATPHIAGFSADGKANGTRMCIEAIEKYFHITVPMLHKVAPEPPAQPFIDLNNFSDHRVERAMLQSRPLRPIDKALRQSANQFESLRNKYIHPREFAAFTLQNATSSEVALWNNCK